MNFFPVLEESSNCSSKEVYLSPFNGGLMMKTQSLPACVRNKARPLSTADDAAELYAKVRTQNLLLENSRIF